jgi:hypothetical protein
LRRSDAQDASAAPANSNRSNSSGGSTGEAFDYIQLFWTKTALFRSLAAYANLLIIFRHFVTFGIPKKYR